MKTSTRIFALATILVLAIAASAQDNSERRTRWMKNMKDAKQEFLIKELQLTEEQQQKFLPLYWQMDDEIFDINREAREAETELSKSENPTDADYARVTTLLLGRTSREAAAESSYYSKFAEILSPKQIFQLLRAESRFTRSMLQQQKGQRRK